jgi:8-oxo-dGTP pyrophosphatase MutT (NUDIX family)
VDVDRMIRFADDLAEPFSRGQATAHFTASAAVVDPSGARTCLIEHAKLGRRLQPGGHVEPDDESPQLAALREAREETGLEVRLHPWAPRPFDVDVHEIPAFGDEPPHLHLDLRYLVVGEGEPGDGAAWYGWDEALAGADEDALRRLLGKARRVVASER